MARCISRCRFSKHLSQHHGFVHAGAITSIVDNACGYAALTKTPQDYEVVTAEFKINFLRPALGEHFLAVGKVQNAGKLLTVCTGEVRAFAGGESSYKVVANHHRQRSGRHEPARASPAGMTACPS
jgi:uncharacterized protein (TIGR00369 family)